MENYHIGGFEERIGEKDWLAAIAYLLVGIESNAPQTYLPIVDGLLKSGFGRDEIVFSRDISWLMPNMERPVSDCLQS